MATAHPASRQLHGNQHGKTTEERREGRSTPQKDKPDAPPERPGKNRLGKAGLRGALACWHSGRWAVAQVRVCSSQIRNLSLSFSELLLATCGVQTLERPRKPNSSRHTTSPVTTEACIIAHAGRATHSPAPANCEQSDVLAVLSRTSATPVFGLAPLFSVHLLCLQRRTA